MSTPPEPKGPPPFDPAHPSVGQVPAYLNTGVFKGDQGHLFIMTVRVANATITAVMNKADAQRWIDQMQREVDQMSSLAVVQPGMPLPPMNGRPNGRPPGQ